MIYRINVYYIDKFSGNVEPVLGNNYETKNRDKME